MANVIHKGDIGNILVHTVKDDGVIVNLSSATTITWYLMDPSGNVATKTNGELYSDGTDGKIKYTLVSGDIDEHGPWTFQSKVAQSTTPIIWNTETSIIVKDTLA